MNGKRIDRFARFIAAREATSTTSDHQQLGRRSVLTALLVWAGSRTFERAHAQVSACTLRSCGADGCPGTPLLLERPQVTPVPRLVRPFGRSKSGVLPRLTCGEGCCCHTDAFYNEYYAHDYGAQGETFPIYAAQSGVFFYGADKLIHIQHGDFWQTVYGHVNPDTIKYENGSCVRAGEHIADASNTGTIAIHLHFELRGGSRNTTTSCANASYPIPDYVSDAACLEGEVFSAELCGCTEALHYEVDMGNPESERQVELSGWGPATTTLTASSDPTARFQSRGGIATIRFPAVIAASPYRFVAEVDDGSCDDSFRILVGETVLLDWNGQGGFVSRIHEVEISSELVTSNSLVVTFENTSSMDCGLAGVYNVALSPG